MPNNTTAIHNAVFATPVTMWGRSPRCRECKSLEANIEFAVKSISLVARTKFESLSEKLQLLREWKDARDHAMHRLYTHRRFHNPAAAR
jgi:hypothetical protein